MELDPLRALRIIEGLCMVNEPEDYENPTPEENILMEIYTIAHSADSTHSCAHVHEDWRIKALETEQKLINMKIFKPWGEKEEMLPFPGKK